LYLYIPSPLKLARQLFGKRKGLFIARVKPKPIYYDQIRAKNEGYISIIPEKDFSKNKRFIYAFGSVEKIEVHPYFLLLPKLSRLYTLWHEYGHCVMLMNDDEEEKGSFHDVCEAMADFYACCKLKLHFNTYIKTRNTTIYLKERFSIKRKEYHTKHLKGEERYQKFNISRDLPLEERMQEDYVYGFYRNKEELIGWYTLCFKDICGMDYQNFFDWNEFLTEIGWDNDEERWKYIGYKDKSNCA
jgi:hypothetical protein